MRALRGPARSSRARVRLAMCMDVRRVLGVGGVVAIVCEQPRQGLVTIDVMSLVQS